MKKDFYIIKNSEIKFNARPLHKILHEEYIEWVEQEDKLTWYKDTEHGKKIFKYRDLPKDVGAYLNYDAKKESSFIQFNYSKRGLVDIYFDYRLIEKGLIDLYHMANKFECNLWHDKPRKLVDLDYIDNLFSKK